MEPSKNKSPQAVPVYYLSHPVFGEKECTREQFIAAERAAGFRPKSNDPDEVATGGFNGGGMTGRVSYRTVQEA